jgi:hypothetical protein
MPLARSPVASELITSDRAHFGERAADTESDGVGPRVLSRRAYASVSRYGAGDAQHVPDRLAGQRRMRGPGQ